MKCQVVIALALLAVVAAHYPAERKHHDKKEVQHDVHHDKKTSRDVHHAKKEVHHNVHHDKKASHEPHHEKIDDNMHPDILYSRPHVKQPIHHPLVPKTGEAEHKCDCTEIAAIRCEAKRLKQRVMRLKNISHEFKKHGTPKPNPQPAPTTPIENPPAPTTPAETPPAPTTPVETPPAPTTPVETPPAPTTPVETPPAPTTPVETPPGPPPPSAGGNPYA